MFNMHLDPENTFFTSDTHFGHKNIIRFCKRPFETVDIMDPKLVDAWNSVVKKNSVVFHLGDFTFRQKTYLSTLLNKLNGTIVLIKGNHDDEKCLSLFPYVFDYLEICIENTNIVLSHYPFLEWNGSHRGAWNLHGHCHGTIPDPGISRRIDVGIDMNTKYVPFSYRQLQAIMKDRVGGPETLHGEYAASAKYF